MAGLALLVAMGLAAGPGATPSPGGACADLMPPPGAGAAEARPLVPEDLVRLRDIGPADPEVHNARLITLSPDGRRIAFQLRRADPDRNAYCLAMLVLDLRQGARPLIVDEGGELIRATIDFRGKAAFPTGIPIVVTPRWSPDGRWIAFLKRSGGITQVWRARTDGSGSKAVTHSDIDVEDFRIAPDGSAILFASRPGLREARDKIAREGRTGFHYDDRHAPMSGDAPFPPAPIPRAFFVHDLASGQVRPASEAEAETFDRQPGIEDGVWTFDRSNDGRRVWTTLSGYVAPSAAGALRAETADGSVTTCADPACAQATRPWWTRDGRSVRFFRREGWRRSSTTIYEWEPGTRRARRLYSTDDLISDCVPSEDRLICLREGSVQPRRLERLDPQDGRLEVLFDPNPEFARLRLGHVERLRWRNAQGLEAYGDLVLPVGYRRGRRYPLIVVQYDTRGFLRGGTGDEYPIQAFAGRGYAVLSVSRPAEPSSRLPIANPTEAGRIDLAGFADQRSTLSSLETGVGMAIERGIADPARIGITGMSNGASTATFALLHSPMFRAAAMSNCCFDTTLPIRVGPAAARHFYGEGYPRMTDRNDAFWREISLSLNARSVTTPILLQLADDEYMSALESYTALREVGAPVDMYIFPGEHHVKWQPAHRLAVYERALDWFDYWLLGRRSASPTRQAELSYWDALRREAATRPH